MAARKRRCRGTTKRGKPCKAAPSRGKKHCRAHDPLAPAATRFGSPEQAAAAGALGGAATRRPRPVEMLRERIEAEIEVWIAPYEQAVKSAVLHAVHEGEVRVSDVADLGARIKAAEAAFDRAYGRPKQTTELSGPDGGAVPLGVDLNDPEVARAAHDFLSKLGVDPNA